LDVPLDGRVRPRCAWPHFFGETTDLWATFFGFHRATAAIALDFPWLSPEAPLDFHSLVHSFGARKARQFCMCPLGMTRMEKDLASSIPTSGDLVSIVEAFDRHPIGALLLCLLLAVVVLGIWAYRSGPGQVSRQGRVPATKRQRPAANQQGPLVK